MQTFYQQFFSIIIKIYQQLTTKPMQPRKLSLASIMDSWAGNQISLRAQRGTLHLLQPKIQRTRQDNNLALFSQLAKGIEKENRYQTQKLQRNFESKCFGQQQFVIKARERSKTYRTTLADLGQIYTNSRIMVNNNFTSKQDKREQSIQKNPSSYKKKDQHNKLQTYSHSARYKTLRNQTQPLISQFGKQKIENKSSDIEKTDRQFQKIRQSINEIKLPVCESLGPGYRAAHDKFELMKKQIIEKIVESGEINEISEILRQIRMAADDIIKKHNRSNSSVSKPGIFSFKDNYDTNCLNLKSMASLNPISQQAQLKSDNCSKGLPLFKDDSGSISSILSLNGGKKEDSKDEQFCKNVLSHTNQQISENQIKPIILDLTQKSENPLNVLDKNESSDLSIRVKNTIRQSKAHVQNNLKGKSEKQEQNKQSPFSQNKEHAYLFEKRRQQKEEKTSIREDDFKKKSYLQINRQGASSDNHFLQPITATPVKIVSNLQQAKRFDPEVVKYTELKAHYLQTRTKAPQIIRIPSPLRFRRKQEVVKCLVENNIVEKQSKSIEF